MEGSTANYLNFRKITGTNLYRGSKSDNLGEADVENLERLGIKCLIDLRSPLEVGCAGIDAAVNHKFQPLELRGEKNSEFEFTEIKTKLKPSEKFAGEHYYIDMLSNDFKRAKLRSCPWYMRLLFVLLWVVDALCGSRHHFHALMLYTLRREGLFGLYCDNLRLCGDKIKAALSLLCREENVPALITCSYGKDRTGIVSALVQSVCGVPEETIIHDYTLSHEAARPLFDGRWTRGASFSTATPDTFEKLLRFIEHRYGSVAEYLEGIGFDRDMQKVLVDNVKENT